MQLIRFQVFFHIVSAVVAIDDLCCDVCDYNTSDG